jgi:hypothetical protein
VANAGPGQSVLINRTVRLDGSLSFDSAGLPITYLWTPGGGVTLSSRTVAKPTFTAPGNTTRFDVNLTVNNGFITSNTSKVTINVVNVPDTVAITAATYRISKQRLDLTATSSIGTATPALAPVLSLVGFGNNGTDLPLSFAGGTYTTIVQGIAPPLSVTVTSSAGGSATSPVTVLAN